MEGSPRDLYNVAAEYLAACAEAVATGIGGPIERVYVSPGPPAWDACPMLTVHAGGPAVGDTFPLQPPLQPGHREEVGSVYLVNLTATVLRCMPEIVQGQTPMLTDPGQYDVVAQAVLDDVWAIWNHTRTLYQADALFVNPYRSSKRELFYDPAVSLMAAGSCAGWQVPIRVQLGGYSG